MVIAVFNAKGGVGKTTTAVNLASDLAMRGRSVLLLDLEADLNSSISLGVRPTEAQPSVAEMLLRERRLSDAIRPVGVVPGLHLITGSPRLAMMDSLLRHVRHPERRLGDLVQPLRAQFDVVVIDSPAGFSLMSLSVPSVADHVVLPTRAEYLALESLAQLLRWYRDRRLAGHHTAPLAGILLTIVDYRRQATREIVDIIRRHNRRGVFRTEIPIDPRANEAPSHGVPLIQYTRTRAALAYEQFTTELLSRIRRRS